MPELCRTMRYQAGQVWNRMAKAARLGVSLSEETITETLLYEVVLAHFNAPDFRVRMASKPQEKIHGADWELWLLKGHESVLFRVQAKRLFPDGNYRSLRKSGADPYKQLDKLVAVAAKDGAVPLYCFFNFRHPASGFPAPPECAHTYRNPTLWGCALAAPERIKKAASIALIDLQPLMTPWHTLVCPPTEDLIKCARALTERVYQRPLDQVSQAPKLRPIPDYVSRLREMPVGALSTAGDRGYVDERIWEGVNDQTDLAGLALIDDRRD